MPPDQQPTAIMVLNKALYVWIKGKAYSLEQTPLFKFLALLRYQIDQLPVGTTALYKYLPPMAKVLSAGG